jgi:hypothetical protein
MKKLLLILAHALFLVSGGLKYLVTRRNSVGSHRALVFFYCRSAGGFNDFCSKLVGFWCRPLGLPLATGVLGDMSGSNGQQALQQLKKKGFVTFEGALPLDVCGRLMQFALHAPAVVRPMDGGSRPAEPRMAIYDASKPLAVRYDYLVNDLLANKDVQLLLADASLLALAEMYLNARPRFDVLSMWWHTNFQAQPDSEAAQFYHFDLDRLKWLKVFIYLTDVGPLDGPHSFIEGSHAPGGIPQKFLDKGYVRLSDEEVLSNYAPGKEVRFSAPRGTIIVEDTRGLHKGNPVAGNPRLILQLQLSNSLFGAIYPKSRLPSTRTPELEAMIQRVGDVYSAYL